MTVDRAVECPEVDRAGGGRADLGEAAGYETFLSLSRRARSCLAASSVSLRTGGTYPVAARSPGEAGPATESRSSSDSAAREDEEVREERDARVDRLDECETWAGTVRETAGHGWASRTGGVVSTFYRMGRVPVSLDPSRCRKDGHKMRRRTCIPSSSMEPAEGARLWTLIDNTRFEVRSA